MFAAACVLLGAQAPAANEDADAAFAAGTRLFESGDYPAALERFEAARSSGMQTVAVAYNIGVSQYRAGRYEAAATTFRRIGRDHPDMQALAHYNLGLALLRLEQPTAARRAFERAREGGDAKLEQLAATMLARLSRDVTPAGPASIGERLFAYVELGAGYDDNVALLEDSGIATGETPSSGLAAFFGQVGGRSGLPGEPLLDASLYAVRYPEAGEFDQNVLMLRSYWPIRVGGWRIEAGGQFSYSTLDGDGFERRLGVGAVAQRPLGRDDRLELRLNHDRIDEAESGFGFVAGHQQVIEVRYLRRSGARRLDLKYGFIIDDRSSPQITAERHRVSAGYRRHIGDAWIIGASVSYRASRFGELAQSRDEELGEAMLMLGRNLAAGWRLSGEYRWSRNDSNVESFGYDRNRIVLSVDRAFP